jgi:hypothetical protein
VDNERPDEQPLSGGYEPPSYPPPDEDYDDPSLVSGRPPSLPEQPSDDSFGSEEDYLLHPPSSLPESVPHSPPERHGRARDRQRRRQERKTGPMAVRTEERPAVRTQTRAAVRAAPQVRPTGAFQMPRIKLPGSRVLLYAVGGVIVVIAIIIGLGRLKNNPVVAPPNGLWLGTEWTYALDESAKVPDLVARLRTQKIGTIYAWVSWLKEDGTWGGRKDGTNNFSEVQDTVKSFVQQFKAAYPEAHLYGWISLPVDMGPNAYRLDDASVQKAVADFSKQVVTEFGFEGVFLNIEPVTNGDQHFLDLLSKVRAALPQGTPVAVAIPPDWSPIGANIPVPPRIVPGTAWDKSYKQSVALLADQMAIMAYNSGLTSAADYSTWVAYQVQTFAQAIAELKTDTQIIIGIPTYPAEPPGHDTTVENIDSAVAGVSLGLQQAGDAASVVSGVAIYAEWTTDDTQWADFKSAWVDKH